MKWIFLAVFCILQSTECFSQEGNQQRMHAGYQLLGDPNQSIHVLQFDVASNMESLKQGYLNAIGLGRLSDSEDYCGGWTPFTSTRCIKQLDRVETYEDALATCRNEFQLGKDISYPTLLKISTGEANDDILKLMENVTSVNAIWINGELGNYTNFGGTSQPAGKNCVEMGNVEVRGKWFHVECEKKNSIICEKKIAINYSEIIEKSIQLIQNFSNFVKYSASISKISENIQKLQTGQQEIQERNKAMHQKWSDKFIILENKVNDLENRCRNSTTLITATTIQPTNPPPTASPANRTRHRHTELHAITATTLQNKLAKTTSVYDGIDSIYIFGGVDEKECRNEIYLFNLSSNAIVKVGTLPDTLSEGSAVRSGENIFYFGGHNCANLTDKVFQFDTVKQTLKEIAQLGTPFGYGDALFQKPEEILLIDGSFTGNKYLRSFNTRTLSSRNVATLKSKRSQSSAFVLDNTSIIFSSGFTSTEILNLTTLTTTVRQTTLPSFGMGRAAVVSDGEFGYIIGGYWDSTESPTNALIRFDPNSFKHEFISIENFPDGGITKGFYGVSAVYVEKLDRIYIIGGFTGAKTGTGIWRNEIWFIELGSLTDNYIPTMQISDPAINSCGNKSNGFQPFTSISTGENKFLGCLNGTAEIFTCPPPLLFDTTTSFCNYPSQKNGDLLPCENKTDGFHIHPQNCQMFLGCQDGFLDIFRCPHPLRFDSISLKCTNPELATCATTSI